MLGVLTLNFHEPKSAHSLTAETESNLVHFLSCENGEQMYAALVELTFDPAQAPAPAAAF